ncbi:MAG: futalosine hydrolase [Taibaiella sp.]|nr:futalosine hydrolase [Taibaiella sp.]
MMNILLVAATEGEIAPFLQQIQQDWQQTDQKVYTRGDTELQICITGVGMTATAYALTRAIYKYQYDFILQAGVGGAYDRNMELGAVFFVTSEQFGDLGVQDHYNFLDLFDLGLQNKNDAPFTSDKLVVPSHPLHQRIKLQEVTGLTINTVSGDAYTIQARIEKYNRQVESMEGAALHYVCLNEKIPFAQIRSISNYVEPRDRNKWQMKEAVIALNKWLSTFLQEL